MVENVRYFEVMQETLYKYLADARHVLEAGFIRASQRSALNDPLEAQYCIDSLRRLFVALEYSKKMVNYSLKVVKTLLEEVGVVCLTETRDNLLMWSHYADNHKGLVLRFRFNSMTNEGIFNSLFPIESCYDAGPCAQGFFEGNFEPVKYRKQPKFRIDTFDRSYSFDHNVDVLNIVTGILLQKSDEWIYEKEHRSVLHLRQSDRVLVPEYKGASKKIHTCLQNLDEFLARMEVVDKHAFYTKVVEVNQILHVFDLFRIEDSDLRASLASYLKDLASIPDVIYLFKLDESVIAEIILGARSHPKDPERYAKLIPQLSAPITVTKAFTDPNSYSLVFKTTGQIEKT
jgi:hypothetical protein